MVVFLGKGDVTLSLERLLDENGAKNCLSAGYKDFFGGELSGSSRVLTILLDIIVLSR